MAAPTNTERGRTVDETPADSDEESRLKRYANRIEERLMSLKEGAEQRSPEPGTPWDVGNDRTSHGRPGIAASTR